MFPISKGYLAVLVMYSFILPTSKKYFWFSTALIFDNQIIYEKILLKIKIILCE